MRIDAERTFIRELQTDDWCEIQDIANDFRKSRYAVYDRLLPSDEDELKEQVRLFSETGLWFVVFVKAEDRIIGYINFHVDGGIYDMGCCFHSSYHGKGYAYESCAALLRHFVHRGKIFTAGTALENIPSRRLLEKLGFQKVQTETLSFHKDADCNPILFEGGQFIYIPDNNGPQRQS